MYVRNVKCKYMHRPHYFEHFNRDQFSYLFLFLLDLCLVSGVLFELRSAMEGDSSSKREELSLEEGRKSSSPEEWSSRRRRL